MRSQERKILAYKVAIAEFRDWRSRHTDFKKYTLEELRALHAKFTAWNKATRNEQARFWNQQVKQEIERREVPPMRC